MFDQITFAVPKGRILEELDPLLKKADIIPEDDFYDKSCRKLEFFTKDKAVKIIRVRSFDVATFVAHGAADIGVLGNDVLQEFNYKDIFVPLNLEIGKCRLSVAQLSARSKDKNINSSLRVATKYPRLTKKFFDNKSITANCIKLNGAMELAPRLGLCSQIIDLVSTGNTLKANDLVEVEKILDVSSHLIVNRVSHKTKHKTIAQIIENFSKNLD